MSPQWSDVFSPAYENFRDLKSELPVLFYLNCPDICSFYFWIFQSVYEFYFFRAFIFEFSRLYYVNFPLFNLIFIFSVFLFLIEFPGLFYSSFPGIFIWISRAFLFDFPGFFIWVSQAFLISNFPRLGGVDQEAGRHGDKAKQGRSRTRRTHHRQRTGGSELDAFPNSLYGLAKHDASSLKISRKSHFR